jgi:phage/plasmid-associated DNA primase
LRRILLVSRSVEISNAEPDKRLGDRLRAEASGILNWLVQCAL